MYLDDQSPYPGHEVGPDFGAGPGPHPGSGPGSGHGPGPVPGRPGGPGRARFVAILSGFAVLGAVLGIGTAELLRSLEQPHLTGALTSVEPIASATDEESAEPQEPLPADVWGDPTTDPATATSAATQPPTATPSADYHPVPAVAADEPGLDFGFLTEITRSDGMISMQFDRASFYTGAEARTRNGGRAPRNDYLVVNNNSARRSFELDPKASVMGANRLLDRNGVVDREPLTVEQLLQNSEQALAVGSAGLPVWLRHSDGPDGPVTALAEQALP
jgi:hypothetical protein